MPSYNKENYIAKAIQSIINQTYKDWELIVIDDASTDNSVEIIKSFTDERIIFRQNEMNIGMAANRNRALDMARGEYIALLDADDITTEFRLQKEVEYLDSHPEIDVVFGSFQEIDENDIIKESYFMPLKNPAFVRAKLMVLDPIPNGSSMYRKDLVDKHNIRYRDNLLGMDDYMFWVECSLCGKITGLSDLFLYWRNTENNGTNTYKYAKEYRKDRERKYGEIQAFALERNGFHLSEDDLALYCKVLSEYLYQIKQENELIAFYNLLKKLCQQAETLENSKEFQAMFRKQFSFILENSYVWKDVYK